MRHETAVSLIKELMDKLERGVNVDAGGIRKNPVSSYTCPDLAAKEWESFFRNHPQVIGMSADLPENGTFFTCNDFGTPILATRTKDGVFKAFANVCRHRGALVETAAKGKQNKFSCPFHAWTYDLEGRLVGLPKQDHFGAVDKECLGLIALPAVEKYGLLFVHPQADGVIDVDALLGGLADEFDAWGWHKLIRTGEDMYETPMNWKLAIDTFGETYHFNTLHRNTLAEFFHGDVQCYDTFDRNHRMILCQKMIETMPSVPEKDWRINHCTLPVYYLFPNVQLNVVRGGMVMVRIYPDPKDPGRSVSQLTFYATPNMLAQEGELVNQRSQGFADVVRDEDYVIAAQSQIGASSGAQAEVMYGRNEPALHHYHNTYREALGMEPLPLIDA